MGGQLLARFLQLLGDEACAEVLLNIAAQRAQDLGSFHAIDCAAAAKGDEHIRSIVNNCLGNAGEVLARRVGRGALNLVYERHACSRQCGANCREVRVAARKSVAHEQRALALRGHNLPNLGQRTNAVDVGVALELTQQRARRAVFVHNCLLPAQWPGSLSAAGAPLGAQQHLLHIMPLHKVEAAVILFQRLNTADHGFEVELA